MEKKRGATVGMMGSYNNNSSFIKFSIPLIKESIEKFDINT